MSQTETTIGTKTTTAPNNELPPEEFNELNETVNANATDTELRVGNIESTPIKSYTTDNLPANAGEATIAFDTDLETHVYIKSGIWYRLDDDTPANNQVVDVFILAGQSNAHGHALVSDLTIPQSTQDAFFYSSWHDSTSNAETTQYFSDWAPTATAGYTRGDAGTPVLGGSTAFGPELGFINRGNQISLVDKPLAVLKYAVGASPLVAGDPNFSDWDLTATGAREGDCWRGLQLALADALGKITADGYTYNLRGLVWWQGESGTSVSDLNAFIAEFRTLVGTSYGVVNPNEFPVVITGTESAWGSTLESGVSFPDPYIGYVSSELYGQYDVGGTFNTHIGSLENGISTDLNSNGINDMFDIGEAYANEMARAIAGTTNISWNPSNITTQLWLDMDDLSTITDTAGVVSSIQDKSGNDYPFAATGSIDIAPAEQNGKNALFFSGNADRLTSSLPLSTETQRWYFVFNPAADNLNDPAFQILKSVTGIVYHQVLFARGAAATEFAGKWYSTPLGNGQISAIPDESYSPTDLSGEWNMFEVEWNVTTATFTIILNGNVISSNIPWGGSFPASNNYGITVNNATSGQNLDGFYGEIVISDNLANQENIQGYLAWKWGLQAKLPANHPYKNSAP